MFEIIGLLVSSSENDFYVAVARMKKAIKLSAFDKVDFIIELVKSIDNVEHLTRKVKDEKLITILQNISLLPEETAKITNAFYDLPSGLMNVFTKFFGSEVVKTLIKKQSEDVNYIQDADYVIVSNVGDDDLSVLETNKKDERKCGVVFLLSTKDNQEKNKQLLSKQEKPFYPLHIKEVETLWNELDKNNDVCAICIDNSFMKYMKKEELEGFIRKIASYSTFIFLRISSNGLKLDNQGIAKIVREEQCLKLLPTVDKLNFITDDDINEEELSYFASASSVLQTYNSTKVEPDELLDDEMKVLISAVQEHKDQLKHDGTFQIESLKTGFIKNGQSGAKIALIKVNKEGKSVVAKIDEKNKLKREMLRYREFIQNWESSLQAELFFHGENAIILFILLAEDFEPAPILKTKLEDLRNYEFFPDDKVNLITVSRNICDGLKDLSRQMLVLNKNSISVDKRGSYPVFDIADDLIKRFESLEDKNITWGLEVKHRTARKKAAENFNKLKDVAITHGDLHLGNIVVIKNTIMKLIDFAASGPGHPAIDLVRLEFAIYTSCLNVLFDEKRSVEFQKALTIDNRTLKYLQENFADFFISEINKVCIEAIIDIRDCAIEAVKEHGGDEKDYYSVKYLLAWQNLLMPDRQISLIRSIILALEDKINTL